MPAPDVTGSIRIGVAGWSYPDWRGVLYPRSQRRGGEDLRLIAELFDCVEINSTFYRDPEARFAAAWARTVEERPDFRFTAKVFRGLTHEKEVGADEIPAGGRRILDGLAPLVEAGRLDVLLAQFPPWFRDGERSRERIRSLVEALRPLHVAVEVRHVSFLRGGSESTFLRFLEEIGAGFVNVDLPEGPGTLPPTVINTSSTGYVRLHGRNARAWFDRRAGRDQKYDYLYDREELSDWVRRMIELAGRALTTYAIANNHFRGQAPANALELAASLGRRLPPLPETFLTAYPRLAELAPAEGGES